MLCQKLFTLENIIDDSSDVQQHDQKNVFSSEVSSRKMPFLMVGCYLGG